MFIKTRAGETLSGEAGPGNIRENFVDEAAVVVYGVNRMAEHRAGRV